MNNSTTEAKPKCTKLATLEIGEKTYGFEVNIFKGKLYITGREMYLLDGVLTFGRNGISIDITHDHQGAMDFVRLFLETLSISTGHEYVDMVTEILNGPEDADE